MVVNTESHNLNVDKDLSTERIASPRHHHRSQKSHHKRRKDSPSHSAKKTADGTFATAEEARALIKDRMSIYGTHTSLMQEEVNNRGERRVKPVVPVSIKYWTFRRLMDYRTSPNRDFDSVEYQRVAFEVLRRTINGVLNKITENNVRTVAKTLMRENIVRGRGLVADAFITFQCGLTALSHVYTCLLSVVNSKFPMIGELVVKRLILRFRRSYRQNDKTVCLASLQFLAHVFNQRMIYEILPLEILTLLMENVTLDSIETSVEFLKYSGAMLKETSPSGLKAIESTLRNTLHEGDINNRTAYIIEMMMAVIKDNFKDYPAIKDNLELIEEEDQITHMFTLTDQLVMDEQLNIFKFDDKYVENEDKYRQLIRDILDSEESEAEDKEEAINEDESLIIDQTECNTVEFRKKIYLVFQSSLSCDETIHKLFQMQFQPGQEVVIAEMVVDCCAQQRTYMKFYGLIGERLCGLNEVFVPPFETLLRQQYSTCHRLEIVKLMNVAKFFAHLLFADSISWATMDCMGLTPDGSSSSRVFLKYLFQELSEFMSIQRLHERFSDETLHQHFCGLFPVDSAENMRFSINFFTAIGLAGLTDHTRQLLVQLSKSAAITAKDDSSDDSSSTSSSD